MNKIIIFTNNGVCPDFFITDTGGVGGLLEFAYLFNPQEDDFQVIDGSFFKGAEECVDKRIYNLYRAIIFYRVIQSNKISSLLDDESKFKKLWKFAQCPWVLTVDK